MTTKDKPVPKDAKNVTKEEKEALARWEKEADEYAKKMVADEAEKDKIRAREDELKPKVAEAEEKTVEHLEAGENEPQRFVTGGATYDEIQAWRAANAKPESRAKQ